MAQRVDPYLHGRGEAERLSDEERLLDFVAHLVIEFCLAANTVKLKLLAIRFQHIVEGLQDPLQGKKRVQIAVKGVKNAQGGPRRKWPVEARIVIWLEVRYRNEVFDIYIEWSATGFAWFFGLRRSEFLVDKDHPHIADRVIRGMDVTARKGGEVVSSFREADEVVVFVPGSKTGVAPSRHI